MKSSAAKNHDMTLRNIIILVGSEIKYPLPGSILFLFLIHAASILHQPLTMQLPVIMHHKEASLCKHLKLILYQTLVKVSFDHQSEV